MTSPRDDQFETLLRSHGYRATVGRVRLLTILADAKRPLTVVEILRANKGRFDQATLYRALDAFVSAKIISRVDFAHGHAHYELTTEGGHHHHLVCTNCGAIEDVHRCRAREAERSVLLHSRTFVSIADHALEFFGLCRSCARTRVIARR